MHFDRPSKKGLTKQSFSKRNPKSETLLKGRRRRIVAAQMECDMNEYAGEMLAINE